MSVTTATLAASRTPPPLRVAAQPASIEPGRVARVLSDLADITSETLELHEVFDRVAASVRQLIPFDDMGVVRIVDGDRVALHASTLDREEGDPCFDPLPLTAWSARWRPRLERLAIQDAEAELDPAFSLDAEVLADGMGSGLWEPFRHGSTFAGGVWLCSKTKHAFRDEHQQALRPIAAILGTVVEHWQMWQAGRRRQDRIERIDTLLETFAESLDVRAIFERLSRELQPMLPHDLMTLNEADPQTRTIRFLAGAGSADVKLPSHPIRLPEGGSATLAEQEIVHDIPSEVAPDAECHQLLLASGLRSWVRVPVWLADEVKGGLSFFHRDPSRYDRDDAEVARRVADRIALTLAHQRLAEEAQVAVEARERAERLEATVETLALELRSRAHGRVVGASDSWQHVLREVGRVAPADTTVLIAGESGTGKEVVAHLLHEGSARTRKPLVAVNCAALPEQLLESELFGHERGAFTGAFATKIGRLEQAAGGTLFLDEIGEMSPLLQAKLLRVLQEREFQRVGGTRTLRADVRVLAATNRDLAAAMARGAFREDLYYRLAVFEIHVPALRDRRDDILRLAEHFLDDLGHAMGRPAAGISRDARQSILAYHWPGNVRELRNAIERAILLCDGGLVTRAHLPSAVGRGGMTIPRSGSAAALVAGLPAGGVDLGALERGYVTRALEQARGNKSKAARLLGLSRSQLYSRLEKHGLV